MDGLPGYTGCLEDVQVEDLEEDPGEDLALRRKLRLLTLNDPYFPKLNFQ